MMKADKCQVGLFLTVTVETTEKELSLHMSDEILASILKHDVSSMDESAIGEGVLLNTGPRPSGPRPTARGPRSTSRPTARGPRSTSRPTARGPRSTSRPTARGPAAHLTARGPQIFGQWYIKAHAQIGISGVWSTVV